MVCTNHGGLPTAVLHGSSSPPYTFVTGNLNFPPKFGRNPRFMAQIRSKTLSRDSSQPHIMMAAWPPHHPTPSLTTTLPFPPCLPNICKKIKGKGTNFETMGGQNGRQCSLRTNWEQNKLLQRLTGSAGRNQRDNLNEFMDPFYLIWMTMTRSKLAGMRAQERVVMQTSHKWQRRWICHLNGVLGN